MSKLPKLTPAEWEIMKTIWELDRPASVREVLEHAYPNGEKAYTTVQTVMNTLEKKQWLQHEKTGLVNFYSPTRPKDEVIKSEMASLVSRVFSGSISALANSLLSMDDLSLEQIEAIKALIDEKERELRGEES